MWGPLVDYVLLGRDEEQVRSGGWGGGGGWGVGGLFIISRNLPTVVNWHTEDFLLTQL